MRGNSCIDGEMQKYAMAQLRPYDLHCNLNMKQRTKEEQMWKTSNQKYALLQPIANHTE